MNKTDKRALYVGGLDKQVTEQGLYTAFVPFGPIKAVQIPMDYATRTSVDSMRWPRVTGTDLLVDDCAERGKGFGFVEFADEADARDAIDNMDGTLLLLLLVCGQGCWS